MTASTRPACMTLAAVLVTAMLGSVANAQSKAIEWSFDGGAKFAATKDALGNVTGNRTIEGRIDDGDPTLNDGTHFEGHTATLVAGQQLTINLVSTEFDAFLVLMRRVDDQHTIVARNDDGGEGYNARLDVTIERAGEYLIVANTASTSDRGRYTLTVESVSNTTAIDLDISDATDAVVGRPLRGSLKPGEDGRMRDGSLFELVAFSAHRGQRLQLDLSSASFDPSLGLVFASDDGLRLLASNDDNGENRNSRIRLQIPYTGKYVAIVNAYSSEGSGAWELAIDSVTEAQRSPDSNWASRYNGGGDPDGQYAVLIGIDDYPGTRADLASCVVDTMEMRRVLVDVLGFRPENIVVINDNEATREHIIAAIRGHLGQASSGGAAFLYFSGHGIQLDSNVGDDDDEPDGKDEAIYVWGHDTRSSVIVDEELGTLISGLAAGKKVVVLDSCHSGTGTLGSSTAKWVTMKDPWVSRQLEMPDSFLSAGARKSGDGAMIDGPSDHILLAACEPHQVATAGAGGTPSIFTYFLITEMERGGTGQSFVELMDRVEKSLGELRDVRDDIVQTPRVEGGKAQGTLGQYFGHGR